MSWKYIDDLLLKFSKNSTLIGKYWVACVLLLRLIVITVFSESVWSDEQREFTCNTKQPGCENICFNKFTPISNSRLWGLQVLAVSLPGALYFTYVLHAVGYQKVKADSKPKGKVDRNSPSPSKPSMADLAKRRQSFRNLRHKVIPSELQEKRLSARRVWRMYIVQILFRLLLECAFVILQLSLYQYRWRVPAVFACSEWPCPHTVDCFISRPQEKSVLLAYMYVTAVGSVIISLVELWYIVWVYGCKEWERKFFHPTRKSLGDDSPPPPKRANSRRGRVSYL